MNTKQKTLVVTKLLVCLILFSACNTRSNKQETKANKEVLVVSILPLKYMVEKIAGPDFRVEVLIPPGESPATYSPSTKEIQAVAKAKVYFTIPSLGFELANLGKLLSSNPDLERVAVSRGMDMIQTEGMQHGDHFHPAGEDPHMWMCTEGVKQIALNVYEAMVDLSPEKEKLYNQNKENFLNEIAKVDVKVKETLNGYNRPFLIFHPSLAYFARAYNLEQIGIEKGGKEPSANHIRSLIDIAREKNIKRILIQKEFDQSNAKIIASEIDGELVEIDPLAYNWSEQMVNIAQSISKQ